jgi:hypothetical protein
VNRAKVGSPKLLLSNGNPCPLVIRASSFEISVRADPIPRFDKTDKICKTAMESKSSANVPRLDEGSRSLDLKVAQAEGGGNHQRQPTSARARNQSEAMTFVPAAVSNQQKNDRHKRIVQRKA